VADLLNGPGTYEYFAEATDVGINATYNTRGVRYIAGLVLNVVLNRSVQLECSSATTVLAIAEKLVKELDVVSKLLVEVTKVSSQSCRRRQ
jgi:hypothetical protein